MKHCLLMISEVQPYVTSVNNYAILVIKKVKVSSADLRVVQLAEDSSREDTPDE